MSIARFAEQTWPDLLSQADKNYVPSSTDLFPNVFVMKLTQRQIEKAMRGIHPKPFGKEATTITNNNIRRHLNENNENINDAAAPTVITTSVLNPDDIPDDPIPMTSDNDNDTLDIDSDDDLPDLSNPKKKEKKNENKFRISDKKVSNDYDKEDKKYKDDKKSVKIKYDEYGKSEKKSNEKIKSEKMKHEGNAKSEKKSYESNSSKHSEKHGDRNKNNEKDKMKNRKTSSDKRENDRDKKDKYKTSSKIDDSRKTDKSSSEILNHSKNVSTSSSSSKSSSSNTTDKLETDLRKNDKSSTENSNASKISSSSSSSSKSSSSNSTDNSETESISSKDNSNSVPPTKPNLLGFLAKTREVKKQKADSQEPNWLERARQLKKQKSENQEQKTEINSNKFTTPVVIKAEPKDVNDLDDNMDFQAPSGSTSESAALSALPDDGDFQSQIDSDQETVAFGGTPEKLDDELNNIENRNSSKKDRSGSKERSEKKDSKDKKRKREHSGSSIESKRQKGDENDKKKQDDRDENKERKDTRPISNQKENVDVSEGINKQENSKKIPEIASRSLPPFAAIPTRDAENPASVSTIKSLPVASAATHAPISSVSTSGITSEAVQSSSASLSAKQLKEEKVKNMKKMIELNKTNRQKESIIKDLQREYEEINSKIIHTESKSNEIKGGEEKNSADMTWLENQLEKDEIINDDDQFNTLSEKLLGLIETIADNKKEKTNLEEEKLKLMSKLNDVTSLLQAKKSELEADENLLTVLKENLKLKTNTSGNVGPSSPGPEGVQKNNNQQGSNSPAPLSFSVSNPASPLIRSESSLDSWDPVQPVITTASVSEQQIQQNTKETTTTAQPKDSTVSNVLAASSPLSLSSTKTSTSSAMKVEALPSVADVVPNTSASEILPNPSPPPPEDKMYEAVPSTKPTCFRCGKPGEFSCCGDTIYCGEECQEEDFDRHQEECQNEVNEHEDE